VVTGGAFLAALTFAVIEAGHSVWSPAVLAAGALSVVLLGTFVVAERVARDPVVPLSLFRRANFTVANAAAGAMNLGSLGQLFVLTMFLQTLQTLQTLQHRSALEAGAVVLALFLPLSVLAPPGGRLTGRLGPRVPMVAGLLVAATGVALLTRANAGSSYAAIAGPATRPVSFAAGLHTVAAATAVLFTVAAVVVLALVRSTGSR
jgi:DHA2 family methylenomycin A resistance protein-like MFS transporter